VDAAQLQALETSDLATVGLAVGDQVGARRWPWQHAHADCWLRPWRGIVLSRLDPRAWCGTLAFQLVPKPEDVSRHVKSCYRAKLLRDNIPVLWCFGDHGDRVHWETLRGPFRVRPYADDLAEWIIAREGARCSKEMHLKHTTPRSAFT
jgi:hypothetical protein